MKDALPLSDQAGVISRRQALEAGVTANDLRRRLRRRDLVIVHPGVYVNHTGELSWLQRAWAAVLFAWPAALCHGSALRAADGPGAHQEALIHIAVGLHRRITAPPGVKVHRMKHLEARTSWNRSPPRLRYEEAALDVAVAARDDMTALGILSAAVQSRRTTAARMRTCFEARARSPRRDWIAGVLDDIAAGTCSVLEHGYLTRVERPHGLPVGERQRRDTATLGVVYRDVSYQTGLIELDGRLFHDTVAQRDRDMDRDLDAAAEGKGTVRLGYGQVFDRPCATAARVARFLGHQGWTGSAHPCGPSCEVGGA